MEVWFGAPHGGASGTASWCRAPTRRSSSPPTPSCARWHQGHHRPRLRHHGLGQVERAFFNGQGGIIIDVSSRRSSCSTCPRRTTRRTTPTPSTPRQPTGPNGKHSTRRSATPARRVSSRASPTSRGSRTCCRSSTSCPASRARCSKTTASRASTSGRRRVGDADHRAEGRRRHQRHQVVRRAGTNPDGALYYTAKAATPTEEALYKKRIAMHAQDMKPAVQNPAEARVSPTYTTKGARLDQLIADARLKYVAGTRPGGAEVADLGMALAGRGPDHLRDERPVREAAQVIRPRGGAARPLAGTPGRGSRAAPASRVIISPLVGIGRRL